MNASLTRRLAALSEEAAHVAALSAGLSGVEPAGDAASTAAMAEIRDSDPGRDVALPIAAHVILRAGGVAVVAAITGRTHAQVFRWRWPRSKPGGTGGQIPGAAAVKLQMAMHRGLVPLIPQDFILPADWRPGDQGGEEAP